MKAFAWLALLVALTASSAASAWQMETVEPGSGQNIIGADPSSPGIGAGSDFEFQAASSRRAGPAGRKWAAVRAGPAAAGGIRRTRYRFYRPGSGRNCSGEGPGRGRF